MVHVGLIILAAAEGDKPRQRDRSTLRRKISSRRANQLHQICSMTAAMAAPVVVLLGVPGLTEYWYITSNSDGSGLRHTQKDPPLITAACSISLAFSILANLCLTVRLVEVHYRFFALSAVTLLSLCCLVNLIALSIFAVEHAHPDGCILSTAFWLTAASSILALLMIVVLSVDGILTKGFRAGGTGISPKQRSLVTAFFFFIVVIIVGSIGFRFLIPHLTFLDSIYFVTQTVITTGFGDIVPITAGGKVFSVFYNSVAIVAFAVVVAFVRGTALEALQESYRLRERHFLSRLKPIPSATSFMPSGSFCGISTLCRRKSSEEKEEEKEQDDADEQDEEEGEEVEQPEVEEIDFEKAIAGLQAEREREYRSQVIVTGSLFAVFWVVGALVYWRVEGWSFGNAIWFCFVAFSTIGFGDFTPKTQAGRAFFCVWAMLGAGILTVFFSILADAYFVRFRETLRRGWIRHMLRRLFGDKDRLSPSSPAPAPPPPPEQPPPPSKEPDGVHTLSETLLDLISNARDHVGSLVNSDGGWDVSNAVNEIVGKVMDEENFTKANRELVELDPELKRFIYLRTLQDKLKALEVTAREAVRKVKKHEATHHQGRRCEQRDDATINEPASDELVKEEEGLRLGKKGSS